MAFHFQECFLCDDELQASTRPEETINYGVLYCLKVMECLKGFGEFISFLISYWHIIFLQRTLDVTIYCASTDENSTNGELLNSLEGRSPKNHFLTFMLFQTCKTFFCSCFFITFVKTNSNIDHFCGAFLSYLKF